MDLKESHILNIPVAEILTPIYLFHFKIVESLTLVDDVFK